MFISVKESRIEHNRSFYGCFYLGSFDSGQSLTIANALRRTLLTECTGLSIISIKIDNVMHEYSTLPGVRDSVLDILLNFKEVILKKKKNSLGGPQGYRNKGLSLVYKNVGSTFFKPVIGYLKMKGPGVIRAKDLNLPPFVQCVDPTQYIATLADDGYLSLKFVIMEGKNYYIHKKPFVENITNEETSTILPKYANVSAPAQKAKTSTQTNNVFSSKLEVFNDDDDSHFWTITKKREKLLKQLKIILETSNKRKEKLSLDNNYQEIQDKSFSKAIEKAEPFRDSKAPLLTVDFFGEKVETRGNKVSSTEKDFYTNSAPETTQWAGPAPLSPYGQGHKNVGSQENFNKFWRGAERNHMTSNINNNNNALYGDSKQLHIDAVFNPVTKVNYIIEGYENYVVESYNGRLKAIENLTLFLDSSIFLKTNLPFLKKSMSERERAQSKASLLSLEKQAFRQVGKAHDHHNGYNGDNTLDSSSEQSSFSAPPFDDHNAYELNVPTKRIRLDKKFKTIKSLNSDVINYLDQAGSSEGELAGHYKGIGIFSNFCNTDFPETLSKDFENLEPCLNISQKEIIILEVWTNGSLHPRDALFMAFKSLSSTFNMYKIKMSNPIFSDSTSYKKIIENL